MIFYELYPPVRRDLSRDFVRFASDDGVKLKKKKLEGRVRD